MRRSVINDQDRRFIKIPAKMATIWQPEQKKASLEMS